MRQAPHALRNHTRRGMSLVELMVGITVGLFVVAAASMLMANQLTDTRKLLAETQLQQDMRATMDIVVRQLRRAGAEQTTRAQGTMAGTNGSVGITNRYIAANPLALPATQVDFRFYRGPSDSGPYGFKLNVADQAVMTLPSDGGWQYLTDTNTLKVTEFLITPVSVASQVLPCPKLCADGTASCWPTLVVRSFLVSLKAEARNDPAVKRSMTSEVRLRNDWVRFNGAAACPA